MRRRLIVVFAAVTTMMAIAFVVPISVLVRDVARERALDDASRDANGVLSSLALTDRADALEVAISRTPAGSEGRLSIFLADGTVIGNAEPPSPQVRTALEDGRAWTGDVDDGAEVVVPLVRGDGQIAVVRVMVPEEDLRSGVVTAWSALGLVGATLVLGSVFVADRLARTVTRPVAALADASARLGEGDLTTRVDPQGPGEVAEVGHAFNLLAERVDGLLDRERESAADLAHRLRTPLAALRLQVDQVDDPAVAGRLAKSADDLATAIDELINEARRPVRLGLVACDAVTVATDRVEFWRPLAEDQGRDCVLDFDAPRVEVQTADTDLAAAIDALLENVFAHTPEGAGFIVWVGYVEGRPTLRVTDRGPGFAPAAARRGASSAGSTGLGLDIARRTAEHAGGQLRIRPAPGGTGSVIEMGLGPIRSA